MDGIGNVVGVTGFGALDEKDGGLVLDLKEVLCRVQGNKEPRPFAMFDDATHVKVVIQQGNRLPHFDVVRPGIQIVHQDVIGVLERPAIVIGEATGNSVESGHDRCRR